MTTHLLAIGFFLIVALAIPLAILARTVVDNWPRIRAAFLDRPQP